jgi:hypothetical protein
LRQREDTHSFCGEGYDGVETTTHNQIIKRRFFFFSKAMSAPPERFKNALVGFNLVKIKAFGLQNTIENKNGRSKLLILKVEDENHNVIIS